MNKTPKDSFGQVRTTKAEFASLGTDAWWMHEQCMTADDLREYYGKGDEEEDAGGAVDEEGDTRGEGAKGDGSGSEEEGRFAWE